MRKNWNLLRAPESKDWNPDTPKPSSTQSKHQAPAAAPEDQTELLEYAALGKIQAQAVKDKAIGQDLTSRLP